MCLPRRLALDDAVNRAESPHMRGCNESHVVNLQTAAAVQVGAVEPADALMNIVNGHAAILLHVITASWSDRIEVVR